VTSIRKPAYTSVSTTLRSVAPVDAAMATKAIKEEKVEQKDLKK